jgi:RNA polymerase sigma-70 factor (ECF subfamily)
MRRWSAEREVRRIGSDPAALEAFYRRHIEAVRGFVARRVDDPHLAADLIAEVFLAALDSADAFRASVGNERQWLFGVARNVVATERRRIARELRAARRISGRALVDAEDVTDLLERIDAEGRARRLYAAMDRLSEDDRALLELVALDGVQVIDAARLLGMSQGAARVRLHRARRMLRDQLERSSVPRATLMKEVPS